MSGSALAGVKVVIGDDGTPVPLSKSTVTDRYFVGAPHHFHYYTVLQILFLVGVGQHFHDICANRGIMEMIPS